MFMFKIFEWKAIWSWNFIVLEIQGIMAFLDILTSRQSLLLGSNLGRIREIKRVVALVFSTSLSVWNSAL